MQPSEATAQLKFGADAGAKPPVRCAACQLQLCKARGEPPHKALTEISRDEIAQTTSFSCQACGSMLTRSLDPSRPGWTQKR